MSFNPEKCFVLRIPASRSPIISNYTLGNSTLQETSSHSYLGVDISNNLKWDTHIDRISASANKTIGFIRRNLRPCTVEARSTAYKALVRPTLEYCCSVWDPYQKGHIKQLGMVQRRAARMVTKNYNWENSASKLMTDLKWENLSARRQTARLSVFHKALGGHLALPVQNYLRPTQRITRQAQSTNTFIQPACRLDVFKYSYIPQTARDWNKLPLNITSIENTDQLKTQMTFDSSLIMSDHITSLCKSVNYILWNLSNK